MLDKALVYTLSIIGAFVCLFLIGGLLVLAGAAIWAVFKLVLSVAIVAFGIYGVLKLLHLVTSGSANEKK